jgi:hypothetical protein
MLIRALGDAEGRVGACEALNVLMEVEPVFGLVFLARGGLEVVLRTCGDEAVREGGPCEANAVAGAWGFVSRSCSLSGSYDGPMDGARSCQEEVERLSCFGLGAAEVISVAWKAVETTNARVAGGILDALSRLLTRETV